MNIVAAAWYPYELPLRTPWQTSQGEVKFRTGRLVQFTADNGLMGWGDCAPWPAFGISDAAAKTFAEECASLDLVSQHAGVPLNAWLSGQAAQASVAVNGVLGNLSNVSAEALENCLAAGFSVIKLKVGIADPEQEIADLKALTAKAAGRAVFRLDANAAWDLASAVKFIDACHGLPIESLEEPLARPSTEPLAQLQASAEFPIAIDESVHLLNEAFFKQPPVRRLVLKPARHGGLLATTEIALRARRAGIETILTSALESHCGLLACAHLAAAIAPGQVHGLATDQCFVSNTGHTARIEHGRLYLPSTPGIGFIPAP